MSLRSSLIIIMVICWFVPIAAISIATNYSQEVITETMKKSMEAEIGFAVETTTRTLDSVVNTAHATSYDGTVFTAYKAYMQEFARVRPLAPDLEDEKLADGLRKSLKLDEQLGKYLNTTFTDGKRVDLACLVLSGNQGAVAGDQIFMNSYAAESDKKNAFSEDVRGNIADRLEALDKDVADKGYRTREMLQENTMFIADNRIWVMRDIYNEVDIVESANRDEYYVRNTQDGNVTYSKISIPVYGRIGVLALRLNTENVFEKMLYSDLWGQQITVMINNQPVTVYPENSEYDSEVSDDMLRSLAGDEMMTYDGENSIVFYQRISYPEQRYSFTYRVDVNKDKLTESYRGIRDIVLTLLIVLIPLVGLGFVFVYWNVNRPVSQLVALAKKLEEGKFGSQIEKKANTKEFAYLYGGMNRASLQLKHYFERGYQEQINLRDARISALQSQINPHFINNTLELMNWKARLSGNEAVSNMIEALSVMLDANLDKSNQPMISLEEELRYSDAYLYIIRQRFGDKVTISKNIDESLLHYPVPRLLIQPFIENAVEHGIEPAGSGSISVDISRKENSLIIEVVNDGKALSEEDKVKIRALLIEGETDSVAPPDKRYTNMGIKNVFQRLRLIFGENGNLIIGSNDQDQTFARIIIPI